MKNWSYKKEKSDEESVVSIVYNAFREKYAELLQAKGKQSDAKEVGKGCERTATQREHAHVLSG